jgi:hypothetical protein
MKAAFDALDPYLNMREHLHFAKFELIIISIAVLENVHPDAGLQKNLFSALIKGLFGDQTPCHLRGTQLR